MQSNIFGLFQLMVFILFDIEVVLSVRSANWNQTAELANPDYLLTLPKWCLDSKEVRWDVLRQPDKEHV